MTPATTELPDILAIDCEVTLQAAAADTDADGALPRFSMVAYTGDAIRTMGFAFPVVVNLDGLIADYNTRHCRELDGMGPEIDLSYLESLGPETLPALIRLDGPLDDRLAKVYDLFPTGKLVAPYLMCR